MFSVLGPSALDLNRSIAHVRLNSHVSRRPAQDDTRMTWRRNQKPTKTHARPRVGQDDIEDRLNIQEDARLHPQNDGQDDTPRLSTRNKFHQTIALSSRL